MKLTRPLFVLAATALLSGLATLPAQEHKELGKMWLFEAIPVEYFDSEYGFHPSQEWLDHARLSSIRYGSGCSSSFVSPRGLIVTNHHCARDHVTSITPEGEDWVRDGHFAKSLSEEVQVPGLTVQQLVSMTDVTDRVNEALADDESDATFEELYEEVEAAIVEAFTTEQPDYTHELMSLYQGGMYQIYSYKIYDDIRLVGVPDLNIGAYGGDPDNFTFPRFCLDFTFMRAWEDGKPADTTAHFFKVKTRGPEDGETIFVTGNPGSTGRLKTVAQMEQMRDVNYPRGLERISQMIANLERQAETDTSNELRNQIVSMQNSFKAYSGSLKGLQNEKVMETKRAAETKLRDAIAADPELEDIYGETWEEIEALIADRVALVEQLDAIFANVELGKMSRQDAMARSQETRDLLGYLEGAEAALEKRIGEAFFAIYGTSVPPDATLSLRISDGVVKGYEYNGTLAPHATSLYGLYARNTEFGNQEPFDLNQVWLDKVGELDLTTPFNLVCTADIIGGNSGSPLLNTDREFVGLVFDGNIESLANEFCFTDDTPRTVCVHPAIMVEALRKVYDATPIADEFEGTGPGYE